MATPKNVKIFQIQTDDLNNLINGQIGISTIDDVKLGVKLWGGKDADGNLSQWLQVDEHARVKVLSCTQEDSIFVGDMNPPTLSAVDSILIGNDITCGNQQIYGRKTSNSNVMIGHNAYGDSIDYITNSVIIGNSACSNTKTIALKADSIRNMISIGDGSGINTLMTSGTGNIFIGTNAGRMPDDNISYGRMNTVLIGNKAGVFSSGGCRYDNLNNGHQNRWKFFDLGGGINDVGYGYGGVERTPTKVLSEQTNKFVIHSDDCPWSNTAGLGRTLPSMVLATSVANYNPAPSKFFGPMTNLYGNFNGATCFVLLSANENAPGGIDALMTTIDTTVSVTYEWTVTPYTYVDLAMYKNVLVSACDGVFSDINRSCRISCAVASNTEGTITFVGDTAHVHGQLGFLFSVSTYECIAPIVNTASTGSGVGNGSMRGIMLGDPLCGSDGQARVIKVTTINNLGTWHTISDVTKKVQWIPPSAEWTLNSANIPLRFTRGVTFSTKLHRHRAGQTVAYSVVGRMIGGSSFIPVVGFAVNTGTVTITSPIYDEYNITVDVDGTYDDGHWFIADDLHTFKPLGM